VPADVTFRQTVTVKLPFVPPEFQAQMREQLPGGMLAERVLRIRADKAYASFGPVALIIDYGHNEVTLLDPKNHRYASVPLVEFWSRLRAAASTATILWDKVRPPPNLQLRSGGAPADLDPNSPIAEALTDVAEFSNGAVPDSAFVIPSGYQAAPFEELVEAIIQTPVALPQVKPDR
jgi:hypothetical protein